MYIDRVPNRNSRPAVLLRECRREGKKSVKRTVANLSKWPEQKVTLLEKVLKDEPLSSPQDVFAARRSLPHGHVKAIGRTIRRLKLDKLIAPRPCREQKLVLAMIAERLLFPRSKLAIVRHWHSTTMAGEFGVEDADENDLYAAMDWLFERKEKIETRLAARHLEPGDLVLYDVSSSYYVGKSCPLAKFGHSRDKKKGWPIIVYGVMADAEGRPVSVEVYPGSTGDPTTVPDQVEKLRKGFGLERVVLVGDRGMLTKVQLQKLSAYPGLGWISALRTEDLRKLAQGPLQMSLFDETRLAEISSPDFPGERLIACFNPLLAQERKRKREELIRATQEALGRIAKEAARRTKKPLSQKEIALKVGKVIGQRKMGKHFALDIQQGAFFFERKEASIEREAALDGIYVIRTSEPADRISADDVVRGYKSLTAVERMFRTLKGLDLRIRPIFHREERRVRAHIFLCMLAYYVEWHMRKALAPVLFDDEKAEERRAVRDPVAQAEPSESCKQKKRTKTTADGHPVHSFETLLADMGTICRLDCFIPAQPDLPVTIQETMPTSFQERVFHLLETHPVP